MNVEMTEFEAKIARIALTEYARSLNTTMPADVGPEKWNGMDMGMVLVMDTANDLNERLEQSIAQTSQKAPKNTFKNQ